MDSPAQAISISSALSVLRVADIPQSSWTTLLARFGLRAIEVPADTPIAGSYWGECEAGLLGDQLYFRTDTPLQSVLHEACHYACMDEPRRTALKKDAGGDYDEENAVCYLQILLADHIENVGRARMLADMDAWGYTFRLGSAGAWFEHEAQDAQRWLQREGLIDEAVQPTWRCRR